MGWLGRSGDWVRWLARSYRVQLAVTLRMTVAAVAGLGLALALDLPLPLWTVLTALIVTQLNIGRSLKTSLDYMAATIGGTIYGAVLALLVPHRSEPALLLVLVLAVAPPALVMAMKRNLNAMPSSIIVVLMPAITHASPFDSAVNRVLEVSLGVFVGLAVAFLVMPASAHRLARQEAARTLELIAQVLDRVVGEPPSATDLAALREVYDRIVLSLAELANNTAEGRREHVARLSAEPDMEPLRRTLIRLRQDAATIGRIARGDPMPEPVHGRVAPKLAGLGRAASAHLRACAATLAERRPLPSVDALEAAFGAILEEMTALRREGFTRELPDEAIARFFALSFALHEMRHTVRELTHDVEVTALAPQSVWEQGHPDVKQGR